jgi:hypothetical protein
MLKRIIVISMTLVIALALVANAQETRTGRTVKDITAEGSCAIIGMSAEQSQQMALNRARAAAIEKAAGIKISSALLVTSSDSIVEIIRTYSRGFITKEEVVWLPLGQYQLNSTRPPIPEYKVKIKADVYIPKKRNEPLGLKAELNKMIYQTGEKAVFKLMTSRPAVFAVFNLIADDRVIMVFPNEIEKKNSLEAGKAVIFPAKDSAIELQMQTLPEHERDAEAFMVVTVPQGKDIDFLKRFPSIKAMSLTDFFARVSEIADISEEAVLPYEVSGK